ncbi:hypothetical protein D3C83_275000 [compost metagenome]
MLKLSHSTMKDTALSQASGSSAPPLYSGLGATMPTLRPSMRASPVTSTRAKRSFMGKNESASTISRMMLRTS